MAPLLRGGPLSKDAVSRLVGRLADDFDDVAHRDLADDQIRYLLLDGWYPKVRIGKRRVRVPVLVTLGVRADGERVRARRAVGRRREHGRVARRHSAARRRATSARRRWPIDRRQCRAWRPRCAKHGRRCAIQRCTAHKLRNLTAKAPVRLREELAEDYRRMIYAETPRPWSSSARGRFAKKWRLRCPAVAESLEEAGDELFTFLRFPRSQWKALRTIGSRQ